MQVLLLQPTLADETVIPNSYSVTMTHEMKNSPIKEVMQLFLTKHYSFN
jgi:hypothetical protein